jgi:aspartate/tyrosine/aromatic aminotransferase
MFDSLQPAPPDPILGLTEAFQADPDASKVNLGVGVYQDEQGRTPALASVKAAETALVAAETTKSYLPITGRPEFAAAVEAFAAGDHPARAEGRLCTAYAPGGTGALRLGAEFLRGLLRPGAATWVSTPTWPNHKGLFAAAGFEIKEYPYYEPSTRAADVGRMMETLDRVPAGDVVLLHLCCHNPTGADLTVDEWRAVAALAAKRGWFPFLDAAYVGFGDGIEPDRAALAAWLDAGVESLTALSFSKNMGLYRERAGALMLAAGTATAAKNAGSHLKRVIRVIYSNAVGHASLTVERVLTDAVIRAMWLKELDAMRARIQGMRAGFAEGLARLGAGDYSFITRQRGMFSFSGLTPDQVARLRAEHHLFMTGDGRINVAGLTPSNLDAVCQAIASVVRA